ncbi:hypothetical protein C900_00587 [Fulvivirga imtechensis AK7]|uniref:PKD domain-containing protein n=1 Tax=Fulvivirga imtechensis AK7 TaxID=1237149 RepID=L8JJ31_9BACT|nr:PKD domain-containing protein [Fulvivirga imtechensis]ELR68233.1 hypothetical protein C900_00587 [Fulvivirga imtechensis AK7]
MKKYLYPFLLLTFIVSIVFYLNHLNSAQNTGVTSKTSKLKWNKEAKEKDRPDLAAAQEIEMTKSPVLGYPPTHKKIEAFRETQRLLQKKANAKAIANVEWTERGPNNVGGRTRALMFDPNDETGKKVWAGAVAGGIWYNNDITDANSQWQNVDDFMANIAISTITYDPQNTNTYYAGTGLIFTQDVRGGGIWKSEDAGATWNHLSSTLTDNNEDFLYVQKIVITPDSKIVVATSSGIQVSTNGGTSWENTFEQTVTDIDLASDGTFYISNYSGDIFKSTDDAETWENILSGSGFRVELASAPSNPLVVYAVSEANNRSDVGYFKKTVDGGENWEDITIPKYQNQNCSVSSSDFTRGQSFFDLILAVYPNDPNSVIVGGIDLHRSTDGGDNWQLLSYWTGNCADYVHADQHAILFKDGSSTTALFGNDGGVFYSENLDENVPEFEERINGYNTALFYACAATNVGASNTYLAGAQDNGSRLFTEPGINSTPEVTGGDGAFCFIDQDNPDIMITSYVYNNYYRSLNGGASFQSFADDNESNGRFINPADYDDETNILYAAYAPNQLAVYSGLSEATVDKATKSISINNQRISHVKVSPYTENRIFIGNGLSQVYLVDNANTNPQLTRIDNDQFPPNGYVSSIEIGSGDDHLLVTLSNYDIVSVWETKDGGDTWTNKEGNLPNMPIRWGLYNPENRNEVLLATEFGVWSTDDISVETPEWEPTVEGLANVKCMMLQYRESDRQVVVATFGRGLFTTNVFVDGTFPDFSKDADITYMGVPVQFENQTIGKVENYLWNFGDGTTSTEEDPIHTYETPGSYTITLSTNDGRESKQQVISVLPDRDGDYSTAEGGDFDSFTDDFIPLNLAGTSFELGSSEIKGKDGTASGVNAWVTGITDEKYANYSTALLYTPHFDLSEAGSYELSFKAKYSFEDTWDGFIVQYTLDSGKTWSKLRNEVANDWYDVLSHENSIFGVSVPIFTGSTSGEGFETKTADISSLSGEGRVGFRFVFRSDPAEVDAGMALDDFQISGVKVAAVPEFKATPVTGTACKGSVVTFHDQSTGSITSYQWDFGDGATPATAEGRGPHSVSYSTAGFKSVSLSVGGEVNSTQVVMKSDFIEILDNNIQDKAVSVISNDVCVNENVTISVENTEAGFTYQLFNAHTNIPVSGKVEGNSGTLEFETGALSITTSYYVEVKDMNSPCSIILTEQPKITVLPTYKLFEVASDEVCADNEVSLTVTGSEVGVTYTLYDITNAETISDDFEGTGDDLEIISYTITDTVDVQIIAKSASCTIPFEPFKVYAKPNPDPVITADGSTLICSENIGSIEWFLDGERLNQFSSIIQARSFGKYTVQVTQNGCTTVSEAFVATILSVEDMLKTGELKVYPNPTSGLIHVNQSGKFSSLRIYSLSGQVVLSRNGIFQNEIINLAHLQPGQYILELTGKSETVKLNIQKLQ